MAKRERVLRIGAFVLDRGNFWKERHGGTSMDDEMSALA
jgi:hypothetical protein